MEFKNPLLWIGFWLVGLSLVLLGLIFLPGSVGQMGPAIIFLSLAATFIFILFASPKTWLWKGLLFIPVTVFLAFGIVFLLNALTHDWGAWAYAWLFCLSALGVGVGLAARISYPLQVLYKISISTAAAAAVLFALFGAIAGGQFMVIFSIILLGIVGVLLLVKVQKKLNGLDWMVDLLVEYPAPPRAPGTETTGDANQALVEPLSKRELEVLQWIDQGLSNAEIAGRLVVAQSTVKTHINNIYTKLGTNSRIQAVRRAKELGLL